MSSHRHHAAAFRMFSSENRQKIMNENPGLGFGQVAKKLEEEWAKLSDADKKVNRVIIQIYWR